MAQLYIQKNAQPDTWVMSGAPTATTVFLSLDADINYSDGTSDTLPANTLAVLPDATTVFDRTHDVYVCYTVQASRVLSVIKESLLPTLTSAYAPLCRIELHGIKPYQPEPYLAAGAVGSAAPQTLVVPSSTSARAYHVGVGGTPPANWFTTGYDDSAWSAAVVTSDDALIEYITGCTMIWSSGGTTGADRALVRHHIALPAGTITAATLRLAVDEWLEGFYINGTAVGTVPFDFGSHPQTLIQTYDVRALLSAGASNLLALYAQNDVDPLDPGGNFNYKLTVTYTAPGISATPAEGDLLSYHSGAWTDLPIGPSGDVLTSDGTDPGWAALPPATSGTVTSVALSLPGIFTVSGSPVTAAGTLSAGLSSQAPHTFWGGPASGSAAAPTFRALGGSDLPAAAGAGGHIHAHGHFL